MIHYELANLVTGKILDSTNRKTNTPLTYQYGFLNPIFTRLMAHLRDEEQAVMALPGTSQSFEGLPAYTPLKVTIKSYAVRSQSDQINAFIAKKGYKVTTSETDGLRYIQLAPGKGDVPATGKNRLDDSNGVTVIDINESCCIIFEYKRKLFGFLSAVLPSFAI